MARQPTMPKALSSLQSVQRSYTSEFSAEELVSELCAKERTEREHRRKGTWSSAATRVVLAKDARRAVTVDMVTAELL
jgi:hypothetical protein